MTKITAYQTKDNNNQKIKINQKIQIKIKKKKLRKMRIFPQLLSSNLSKNSFICNSQLTYS